MRWGSQQGLRCGEASPNQGLGGTSGQRPNADSQRQPDKEPTTTRNLLTDGGRQIRDTPIMSPVRR